MFNTIARTYDRMNDLISLNLQKKIKETAIKNVQINADAKVLDICTGTGDIGIYLAQNVVKNGRVVGIDFSENMLDIAKIKSAGINNIEFKNGDALALPFEDGTFDACFISFGLRNLVDLRKGLIEMKRVTKDGGVIVNLDLGKPYGIFKFLHKVYFFNVVPFVCRLLGGDTAAYKYLPQSTINFPNGEELVEVFKEIGLKEIEKYDFLFGAISEQTGKV